MATHTVEQIRVFVLASLEMTEESLGTGVLEVKPGALNDVARYPSWTLRYADSCGTFEGSVVENADGTLAMEWEE